MITECKVCGLFFRGRLTCNSLFFFVLSLSSHSITFSTICIAFHLPFTGFFFVCLLFTWAFPLLIQVPNLTYLGMIAFYYLKISTIHSYNTRSRTSSSFHVKSSKLEIHKNSFSCFGLKLWNEIPRHIRDLPHGFLSDILKKNDYNEKPLIIKKLG